MDTAFPSPSVSPSISPAELAALLGRADAPLLLDVRRAAPFAASQRLLPGARHCLPEDVAAFASAHAPRDVVTYCVYGHGVGLEAARVLREAGWNARALEGGIEGGEEGVDPAPAIAAWRSAPLARLRKRPDLGVTGAAPSRWITRARPRIDRIACPWLIQRFIDPRAEFHYVPAEQVQAEALGRQAVPYDIAGVEVSHRGDQCSFDTLLALFDLRDRALHALARIVRGADTGRLDEAPQSAGLLALSLGLSRLHADDHAMLATAMPLYDALYAWCRDVQAVAQGATS